MDRTPEKTSGNQQTVMSEKNDGFLRQQNERHGKHRNHQRLMQFMRRPSKFPASRSMQVICTEKASAQPIRYRSPLLI